MQLFFNNSMSQGVVRNKAKKAPYCRIMIIKTKSKIKHQNPITGNQSVRYADVLAILRNDVFFVLAYEANDRK